MKRLFFLLLLVNLGLAGWGYYGSVSKVASPQPTSGGDLRLLAERDASAAAPGSRGYDLEQIPSERPTPPPPAPADAGAAMVAGASPSSTTLTQADLPEPEEAPSEETAAAAAPPPTEPQARVQKCHALGAFDQREDAEQAAAQLASISVAAKLRQEVAQRANGFWVLIPPMASRDAARDMEKRLGAAGITDVGRLVRGDLQNAVSLGLFSRREAAERRRDQVAAQGFAPEVRPRYSDSEEFWLDFPADSRVDPAAIKRRFTREHPGIQLLERECVVVSTP